MSDRTKPLSFVSFSKRKEVIQKLNITSRLNEVGFFLEILGNPKISELKNSIWETLGKSLGDLAIATEFSS